MRLFSLAIIAALIFARSAEAAPCGNTSSGFQSWKADFAKTAKAAGVKAAGLDALATATYATRTISADRNQKSFK